MRSDGRIRTGDGERKGTPDRNDGARHRKGDESGGDADGDPRGEWPGEDEGSEGQSVGKLEMRPAKRAREIDAKRCANPPGEPL